MYFGPYLLVIALLLFWTGIGWSALRTLGVRCDRTRLLLISPLIGICVILILVLWLNVAGLPVGTFARPLTGGLAVLAAVGVFRWPPLKALSRAQLIIAVVLLSVLVCGIPALLYGFDWISNTNDDWANYNLGALRFLHSGFFVAPDPKPMLQGENYPGYYWFIHAVAGERGGSELLLAWLAGVVGRNPFFLFMPLVLALEGALMLSAAALASRFIAKRHVLIAGLVLTAFSPLTFYAVQQQLIAQVAGLSALAGLSTLALVPLRRLLHVGTAIACGLIASGMLLIYPEVIPIFGPSFVIYQTIRTVRARKFFRVRHLLGLLTIAVSILILTGPFAINALLFMLSQAQGSASHGVQDGVSIFPWFFVPSGLANWWGFIQFAELPSEPWLSIWIAVGLGLTTVTIITMIFGVRRADPISCVALTMLLVAFYLIHKGDQFGIFKLAMFSGMVIWFLLTRALATIIVCRAVYVFLVVATLGFMVPAVRAGIDRSTGVAGIAGTPDIPNGSRDKLLSQVLKAKNSSDFCHVDFETALSPLIKILGAQPGCQRVFIGRDIFSKFASDEGGLFISKAKASIIRAPLLRPDLDLAFPSKDGRTIHAITAAPPSELGRLGVTPDSFSIFNIAQVKTVETGVPGAFPNRLIFVHSDLGNSYYLPDSANVAFYQSEKDQFFQGPLAALGRYLLFRVNAPSPRIRLKLWISSSYLADGNSVLPPVAISGEKFVPLGLSGRGSARVVSEPLTPLHIDGRYYLLLDLGRGPQSVPVPRPGLMGLYGRNIVIDTRRVVTYAHRIMLIDNADYDRADTVDGVRSIPYDLGDPRLEYQGIYEDGWIGATTSITLSAKGPGRHKVVVHGMVPGGMELDAQHVAIRVNGKILSEKDLTLGNFSITAPIDVGPQNIALEFKSEKRLPSENDRRMVAALLKSIVIVNSDDTPSGIRAIPRDLSDPRLEYEGIYDDGWTRSHFEVTLAPRSAGDHKLVVRGVIPSIPGLDTQRISVFANGKQLVQKDLKPGDFAVEAPIGAGVQDVKLDFASEQRLSKADARQASALLKSIVIE
ncbi:MAG: hypothetical protein ACLP8A_05300 [Methylovirgula sp.]